MLGRIDIVYVAIWPYASEKEKKKQKQSTTIGLQGVYPTTAPQAPIQHLNTIYIAGNWRCLKITKGYKRLQ